MESFGGLESNVVQEKSTWPKTKKVGQRKSEEGTRVVRDSAVHGETTLETNQEGREGFAGRRIVGRMRRKAQGPRRGDPSGSCQGLFVPLQPA